ncbi:uncharacterized protein N7511_008235 [Penicillium nucicola]|uniref:uncharacterized protein n=1 Tax=Penicillium nucicola TaxID=1850975 RepID=UPI002544DB8D|nr:uncharacterized protein N7511_008235 [Penicillium nucicola]KAJ5754082.1 hypothetical protein N7511_008235 [Penicillium nucicola]
MPALRSRYGYAGHMHQNDSTTPKKRNSRVSIHPTLDERETGRMSPPQDQPILKSSLKVKSARSAANIAPAEILLDIFSMLAPRDFDNARRTCSQWMRVSLNHKLLEAMLRRAGWWDAWLQDCQKKRLSTRSDESEAWRMSRRFATECLLSGRRVNIEKSGFLSTATVDFSGLSNDVPRKTRGRRLQPVLKESKALSTFSISSCSNYLLVTNGCMIYVYHLLGRKSHSASLNNLSDVTLAPVSRISCPFEVISAVIDTSTSRFTVAALLDNRVGMIHDLDMSFSHKSSTKTRVNNNTSSLQGTDEHPTPVLPSMPTADPTSRHFFYNICTPDSPPRTIALCPGRRLVGFGCAAGIEIHSMSEPRRMEQRKHFPMPQPSEILHFLPSSPEAPNELRLISSLAGPGFHECNCPSSPTSTLQSTLQSPSLSPTPQAKNQFHFLADVQSFSRRRIPHTPSRSFVRATHCHHYGAVPINDNFHLIPKQVSSASAPPPPSAAQQASPAPSSASPHSHSQRPPPQKNPPLPTTFTSGADLSWGLRVVAAYGNRIVLYSIPLDVYNAVCKERERQSDGVLGDSTLTREWYIDADQAPKPRESLARKRNGDWEFRAGGSYGSAGLMWPFKVFGKEIGAVDGLVELSVQSSEGGARVWAFGGDGRATIFDVDTFSSGVSGSGSGGGSVPVSALRVGADGSVEGLDVVERVGLGSLRKRKAEVLGDGFVGRYGAGRHSINVDGLGLVKPCAAGVHGIQQDSSVRRTSFAACILDFKIPEFGI